MSRGGVPALGLRSLGALRCVVGVALVAQPDRLVRALAGRKATTPACLARTLGGRVLAQSLIQLARPVRRVAVTGAAVDATHAASMVATATLLPSHRRVALASGVEAVAAAAGSYGCARGMA